MRNSEKFCNLRFAYSHWRLKFQRKILYAITPPPRLKNIGDHAQVIAIQAWFKKHFSGLPVLEMDKDQSRYFLPALHWLIGPNDLIFLHSGGNLGDRSQWSEGIRRLLISSFPHNQIISLPQTIHFSDTPKGRQEAEISQQIYGTHPNLTIIARDLRSGEIAKKLFPKAQTFNMPDFVLSLPSLQSSVRNNPPQILLCFRHDKESALTQEEHKQIKESIPYPTTVYDTTLANPINVEEREDTLRKTLELFKVHDVIVTDRFHGLIFSVLCKRPCIVLRTVDHKLTSAAHWFKDVQTIIYAQELGDIPLLVKESLKFELDSYNMPNWNLEYFDKIPQLIG